MMLTLQTHLTMANQSLAMPSCWEMAYSTKKQTATVLSTSKAEYYAATHAGHEILWLRELTIEIGFALSDATYLHIDKMSTIHIITKADEVTLCSGLISPTYMESAGNFANIFTKPLPADSHWHLMGSLGLEERANIS